MPQPGTLAAARLQAAVPGFGSPRNPCDATAQASRNPDSLIECVDALLSDPQYAALVFPWSRAQPLHLLPRLGELSAKHNKPVCIVWMSQRWEGQAVQEIERSPQLALFRSLDSCCDALAQWLDPRKNP